MLHTLKIGQDFALRFCRVNSIGILKIKHLQYLCGQWSESFKMSRFGSCHLTLPYDAYNLYPCQGPLGWLELFESCADWYSALDIAMVLLYDIVQILTASASDPTETSSIYRSDSCRIGSALIDVDYSWSSVVSDCLIEKLLCWAFHPPLGQQKINCVTIFVHCSIKIPVLPSYFNVSLVHSPTIADTALSLMHIRFNQRWELEHPAL